MLRKTDSLSHQGLLPVSMLYSALGITLPWVFQYWFPRDKQNHAIAAIVTCDATLEPSNYSQLSFGACLLVQAPKSLLLNDI